MAVRVRPARARSRARRTGASAPAKRARRTEKSSAAGGTTTAGRRSAAGAKPAAAKTVARKMTRTGSQAKPKELVKRVYNTIDSELSKLEKQKGATSQDRERASRALSQMVNSLEKAVEMQRALVASAKKKTTAKDREALAHAEDLRREIAERLERLNRKRADG